MFDAFETSRFLGRPVRLFVFTRQALVWRFASADRDIVIGADTYLAAQIERDEIKQTAERAKDKLGIRFAYLRDPDAPAEIIPSTQTLGDNWHPYPPSDTVSVRCLATHYGDTDPPAVEWIGVVTQPKFSDVELELTALAEVTAARRRIRPSLDELRLTDGRRIYLLAEGRLVNLGAAEGHPADVMDLSFATQALTVAQLGRGELAAGVHRVPTEIDAEVARLKLAAMGVELDRLSDAQQRYLGGWRTGT